MYKLVCFSDSHGYLPDIPECDLVLISGDIIPLDIQRNANLSYKWLTTTFTDWIKRCKCQTIYMIAGNHDFYFQSEATHFREFIENKNLRDKFCYLQDNIVIDETTGFSICGIPWITGLSGWAFNSHDLYRKFSHIDSVDILLCHQPPKYEKIGCSYPNTKYERDFGSSEITDALKDKNIKLLLCGHIHSGDHSKNKMGNIEMYNVSLLDEDYRLAYPLLELNVDKNCNIIENAD